MPRLAEDSDSDRSSDEEINFKRKLSSKKNGGGDDQVDNASSSSGSSVGVRVTMVAGRAPPARVPIPSNNTVKIVSSIGDSNGVKAMQSIPCPVITRQPSDHVLERHDSSSSSMHDFVIQAPAPPMKRLKEDVYSSGGISFLSSATDIMKTMGFNPSKGLGQTMNNCEVSLIALEQMEKLLQGADIVVDDNILDLNEELSTDEIIQWIKPPVHLPSTEYHSLVNWKKTGPKKCTIQSENMFIDSKTLSDLLVMKKCMMGFNQYEYNQVRARSNPFESLEKGPFLSRAALKMVNLDFALSHSLTQPPTNSGDKLGSNELFYFADICAGPGGFSEYVLYKRKWDAKGFGMTLKGGLDFDLWSSNVADAESFEPFYGPSNDGNVYNPNNTKEFIDYVRCASEGHGVHLMMADGGFDVDNKELQEVLSAQIYLSQCYLALAMIRTGGMFVCKLFDALTPFSVGLIFLMYLSFEHVAVHKPITSRPANSERYLICKLKKQTQDIEGILAYLQTCYVWFANHASKGEQSETVLELVPLENLKANKGFMDYIIESNTRIARQQVEQLKKMVVFSRNPTLRDPRQEYIRKKLFEIWKVPSPHPDNGIVFSRGPAVAFKDMLGSHTEDFLKCDEYSLNEHNYESYLRSPFDWRIVVVGGTQRELNRSFYLSLGRDRIYRWNLVNKEWLRIEERVELTKGTLVYGEFVEEINGKKPTLTVFHIIDAMMLGGVDVRSKHYTARLELCIKFAKSMNRPNMNELLQVKAKIPVRMENIADVYDRLELRTILGRGPNGQLLCPVDHTDETLPFIKPTGILFLKITKDPWTMALSKSCNRKYYFNLTTGASSYDFVPESISDFEYTMQHRMMWWWDKDLKNIFSTQDVTEMARPINTSPGTLNPQKLLDYINGGTWQANRAVVMRRLSSSSSQGST